MRFSLLSSSCLLAALLAPAASFAAADSALLASKSISHLHAVQNRAFVFSEDGTAYSTIDLFAAQPVVVTRAWQWLGGAEGGAPWGNSLLLRANYWISDSQRVARATSLRYAGTFRGGDSLVFRDRVGNDTGAGLANSANFTALAVRDSSGTATAVLGFGRLGIAYARLAPENSGQLFLEDTGTTPDSALSFLAFPTGSDTALALHSCRWNAACRVDTLGGVPPLDSVIALAVDSSHADSAWLLVATSRGLRRGLWSGAYFPRVTLPGTDTAGEPVRSVFASPSRALAWAFTGSRYFYSDDHGATFRVPPDVPGVNLSPASLSFSSDRPPHAAFRGDTTIINFNFDNPGLVLFRNDTILANNGGGLGEVLLDTADGLAISRSEGSLTQVAVVQGAIASQAVLVAGSTLKGVFHKRLDVPGAPFLNINRQKSLKGGLGEVITYPTLITTGTRCGDEYSRIGYRLSKDGRVTITVYNYAMEKVRTIVRNARRTTVAGRSENLAEDRWDGCDESGRFVSVGAYYVLVESDQGEKAFGKILVTRGRK